MKNKIYVFTKNNCRIIKFDDESEISHLKVLPHLINPKTDHLSGVKTHHYRMKDSKIESLTGPEMVIRDQQILRDGIDNELPEPIQAPVQIPLRDRLDRYVLRVLTLHPYVIFFGGMALGALIFYTSLIVLGRK